MLRDILVDFPEEDCALGSLDFDDSNIIKSKGQPIRIRVV